MKLAFLAPLALTVSLAGCASSGITGGAIVSSTINPNYASAAVSSFATVEATAQAYLSLPLCVTGGNPVCRIKAASDQIVPLIRSARTASTQIRNALRASNGAQINVTPYNTLQGLVTLLQGVYASYSITTVKEN